MKLVSYELEQEAQPTHNQEGLLMINPAENNINDTHRYGEHDIPITFRTNRFFSIGVNWYFSTREGIDHGPFDSKKLAELGIEKHISELKV